MEDNSSRGSLGVTWKITVVGVVWGSQFRLLP